MYSGCPKAKPHKEEIIFVSFHKQRIWRAHTLISHVNSPTSTNPNRMKWHNQNYPTECNVPITVPEDTTRKYLKAMLCGLVPANSQLIDVIKKGSDQMC